MCGKEGYMNDTRQALEKDVRDNLLLLYDFDKDYDVKLLKYSENVIFKITFKTVYRKAQSASL